MIHNNKSLTVHIQYSVYVFLCKTSFPMSISDISSWDFIEDQRFELELKFSLSTSTGQLKL